MAQRTTTKAVADPTPSEPPRTKRRVAARTAKQGGRAGATKADAHAGILGGLVLAMALGCLGFLFSFFWVGAIVVMAVLLGIAVAERRAVTSTGGRGVVTEVVAAVVDEVQGISEATAQLKGDSA